MLNLDRISHHLAL